MRLNEGDADERLVARLQAGDEAAFIAAIDRYGAVMLRLSYGYVHDRAVAEEVVQEAWLAILTGISRFEGRSSLKTWILRIVRNIALRRGKQERRTLPVSSLQGEGSEEGGDPSVSFDRFRHEGDRWAGHWTSPPEDWTEIPERALTARETLDVVGKAIAELPPRQRRVLDLRDVEGWTSVEVCELLEISEANQRVLLHRARSKVREALDLHFASI